MDLQLKEVLNQAKNKNITVLTGAGISAESGIPTFRGPEGYWTVGSKVYYPEELATKSFFESNPEESWRWYINRWNTCKKSQPNKGHYSIVTLERNYRNKFKLVTQNVDNLHTRAGSYSDNTYEIHGNIFKAHCFNECSPPVTLLLPNGHSYSLLHCDKCGAWLRPHVLWFDERYDQVNYHADDAADAVTKASLLIVVGTTGATSLPFMLGTMANDLNIPIIDINIEDNPFRELAKNNGCAINDTAVNGLSMIVDYLIR